MTNLLDYFPQQVGVTKKVQAKILFWLNIGHGTFESITENSMSFSGHGKLLGHEKDVKVAIRLIDESNAEIDLDNKKLTGTYSENPGESLTVNITSGSRTGSIKIIKDSNGTYLYPTIKGGVDLHIEA